jgi:general secretion pathway protein G
MGRIIVTGKEPVCSKLRQSRGKQPASTKPWSAYAKASARQAGGFTLMELLIVITLIVVLAGIALSTYATSVRRAKEATLKENLFRLNDSLDQYYADKGTWPPDLSALVSENYIRQIPKDPITESTETWQLEMSEPDPSNPDAAPGVKGVKSGAPGTSLDGSNYADW